MRPDVKLGVMLAFVMVVVAGGYYMYRDRHENPIPLSGNTSALQAKGGSQLATKNARKPSSNQPKQSAQRVASKQAKPKPTRSATRPVKGSAKPPAKRSQQAGNMAKTTTRGTDGKGAGQKAGTRQDGPSTASPSNRTATNQSKRSPEKPPRNASVARKYAQGNRATQSLSTRAKKPATTTPPAGVAVETHRVQPGDTFALLAKTYYGDEKYTQYLLDHNQHISAPTRLRVGDSLKIPALPSDRSVTAPRTRKMSNSAKVANSGARTYTVRPGDSFYAIAQEKLGDSSRWEELLKLNAASVKGDAKKLQVGQVITLPSR